MCEGCATSVPVVILLGHSGFGYSFGNSKDYASNKIQEVISLGRSSMWNNAAVCGVGRGMKIWVSSSSEMWKFLYINYFIIIEVPLMC